MESLRGCYMLLVMGMITLTPVSAEPAAEGCPNHCQCSKDFKVARCKGKKLTKIPANFSPTLTILDLDNNEIAEIPASALAGLNHLTVLRLTKNVIARIEKGAFEDQGSLVDLHLTNNRLRGDALTRETFRGLKRLKNLHLGQNSLTAIPDVFHLPSLYRITLDFNRIKEVDFPASFEKLQNFTSVTMGNNKIQSISGFGQLNATGIKKLGLSKNNISHISPGAFEQFSNLKALVLSYNPLPKEYLLNAVDSLHTTTLHELDLNGVVSYQMPSNMLGKVAHLPLKKLTMSHSKGWKPEGGTFAGPAQLRVLDLSKSEIDAVSPNAFVGLEQLKELRLEKNMLQEIPVGLPAGLLHLDLSLNTRLLNVSSNRFSHMSNLSKLVLSRCSLETLHKHSFAGLSNLSFLNLASNKLARNSLPGGLFEGMSSLKNLSLARNNITHLTTDADELFSQLVSLVHLDLSENQCEELHPTTFQSLYSLRVLDLHANKLGNLLREDTKGDLFKSLNNLTSLDLRNNSIPFLPRDVFQQLKSLVTLNLQDNLLTGWESGLFNSFVGTEVNLRGNEISVIDEQSVDGLKEGVTLDLTDNTFGSCCGLKYFRNWMNVTNVTLKNNSTYSCSFPPRHGSSKLVSFEKGDLENECSIPSSILQTVLLVALGCIPSFVLLLCWECIKWRLQYRWYRFKRRVWRLYRQMVKRWRPAAPAAAEALYDEIRPAQFDFSILYAPEDRYWVIETLVKHIDRTQWRIFFEDEDIDPNQPDLPCIVKGIEESQRTILVISKAFLGSYQKVDYEVLCAITNAEDRGVPMERFILITLGREEEIQTKLRDTKALNVLWPVVRRQRHLWWPASNEARRVFWEKLKDQMNEN